jgi:hypothetical protein
MRGKRRRLVRWTTVVAAAAARRTGRPLLWGLWGRALLLGGVAGGLVLRVGGGVTASWEPPRAPFTGLPALPRVGEPPATPEAPALRSDTPDGGEDATSPLRASPTRGPGKEETREDR